MARSQWEQLGQILIQENKLTEEKLYKTLKLQQATKEKLGQLLVKLDYVTESDIAKVLSKQFAIPHLSRAEYPDTPPQEIEFSLSFMQYYMFAPIGFEKDELSIVMEDPLDLPTIDAIKLVAGCTKIKVYLGTASDILAAFEHYYGSAPPIVDKVNEISDKDIQIVDKEQTEDVGSLRDMAKDGSVIKLVNLIIAKAIIRNASDVHLEVFADGLKVRYRVDGVLYDTDPLCGYSQAAVISRVKIMADMDIAVRRLPQDGRIHLRIMGKKCDLRVASIPTLYGESIVMRILNRDSELLNLAELGFPDNNLKQFESLIHKPNGFLLVTGPTGSGKTTSLYAALNELNSQHTKIITIEDPIEYLMKGINQIQIRPGIGLSFANGLRSIVRQDPDIIMVGEIRDLETAEVAIQSALTGHMVFSTLHTNDAPGAITRLLDMGLEHYLLASCLEGLLAQRLVRVICHNCKQKLIMDKKLLADMRAKGFTGSTSYEGKGCQKCNFTGYRGRIGIYELLVVNDNIRQLILGKTSTDVIRKKAQAQGMRSLRDDGWNKVKEGITSIEEVLRVTQAENALDITST